MSESRDGVLGNTSANKPRVGTSSRWLVHLILALVVWAGPARADDGDDQYLAIHWNILQADVLSRNGQADLALAKYSEAQAALIKFEKTFPTWHSDVVSFRLHYLDDKVATAKKPAESAIPAVEAEVSATSPAVTGGGPRVKLLDAGAEPRQVLRLHPKPGDQQKVEMTVKLGVETKMGEMQVPAIKMPAMKLMMDTTVKEVSAEGVIAYETVISEAGVVEDSASVPQVVQALKAAMAGLKGMSGTGKMSGRNYGLELEFNTPAGADPQVRQMLDQMKDSVSSLGAPLPEEAVGPGAKWEAATKLKSQGMTINQTATYQLASLEGERLTTKSTISQSAANQKIQNPAMPGLKMDLTKMTGNGTADVAADLGRLLPGTANMDFHSNMAMSMNTGGQKQNLSLKMDMNLHLESK